MKMIVFGTRPEIIKLYPVIKEMKDVYLVWTGQHDELAKQMLKDLNIKVDENLKVMSLNQSLTILTIKLHQKISEILERIKPETVIVQGDTTSAMVAALEAYYHKIPVAHIEAGLRTGDIYQPFPEEINRRIITQIAETNFTPTRSATINVLLESMGFTYETGNTAIDTLKEFSKKIRGRRKKKVLMTIHRRENIDKIPNILEQVNTFVVVNPDWKVIVPLHPNPNVRKKFYQIVLPEQIKLIEPLSYFGMIKEMKESAFIVTDSGGIQEEAPTLNRFVFVIRESTERKEGLGECAKLVDIADLFFEMESAIHQPIRKLTNPYGDGHAGRRIAQFLK